MAPKDKKQNDESGGTATAVNEPPTGGQGSQQTASGVAQPLSLGRVVLFTDPEGKVSPAIVTEIAPSGEIHVCAFDSVMGPRNYVTSGEGTAPGQWSWPPRA